MNLVFYLRSIPLQGSFLEEKPLGGTESALLYLARALVQRTHRVRIYCEAICEEVHEGVSYRHWSHFEEEMNNDPPDVFVSLRSLFIPLVKRWAPLQIYFSPDAPDQSCVNAALQLQGNKNGMDFHLGLYSLRHVQHFVDGIMGVGIWQISEFVKKFNLNPDRVFIFPNGVDSLFFSKKPVFQRKKQIIYCSTPFRGLEFLLNYFPKIRSRIPDATCLILSGMQLYGASDQEDQQAYQKLYELANQPGVTLMKPVNKREMAPMLSKSRVLAYPNTFAETFCIAALESQAAGLPIVTTDLAGLRERVTQGVDGYLIKGHPSEETYRNVFIEKVCDLLTQDDLWSSCSHAAQKKAQMYHYPALAILFEKQINSLRNLGNINRPLYFKPQRQKIMMKNGEEQIPFSLEVNVIQDVFKKHMEGHGLNQLAALPREVV